MVMYMKKIDFYIKSILLIFGINALIYFLIKLFIINYHIMSIPLDAKIPYLPGFVYIYMIWYPFLIISFYFIYKYNKTKYIKMIIAIVLSLLVLYMCFILYPSMVIRPTADTYHDITSFVIYVVFKTDTPVNCFPSGHCLLCFLLLFSVYKDYKLPNYLRYIIIIINILIIASTLLIKQHVIVDVIGSFILSTTMYYIISNFKYFDKIKNKMKYQIEISN